jgi:hypothetical protein
MWNPPNGGCWSAYEFAKGEQAERRKQVQQKAGGFFPDQFPNVIR